MKTRPSGDQLKFQSARTGEHILDTYLEASEKGGRTLPDILDDLWGGDGFIRQDVFQFRVLQGKLQSRTGDYVDPEAGWRNIGEYLHDRGMFSTSATYNDLDVVQVTDGSVYITRLSAPTGYVSEAAFMAAGHLLVVDITQLNTAVAAAETSANEAAASELAASNHKDAAAGYRTDASNSAAAAFVSETNAANSAAASAASAADAATSEGNAATSASNAATSETNASGSAAASAASASAASTSETNAANSAGASAASASAAATSESNAGTSESNAAGSATASANSATASANSATASASSASQASGHNDAAALERAAAENAKTAAQAAQAATEALFDGFDDRFLGSKPSEPTLDNDGAPLTEGTLYWDETLNKLRIYNGSAWENTADGTMTSADVLNMLKLVDGSGSGLDADTVDGKHGSELLDLSSEQTITSIAARKRFTSGAEIASGYSQSSLEVFQPTAGADAFMTYHVATDFGAYFGLDGGLNDFVVGGWSMGANKYRVWHEGNHGSGSGLDADTLDGYQASAFAKLGEAAVFTQNVYAPSVIATNGALYTDAPSNAHNALLWFRDENNVVQGLLYWNRSSDDLRLRRYNATGDGVEGELIVEASNLKYNGGVVWHSLNDGASSGLDADLLDGYHASAFARLGVNNTFTGGVTIDTGASSGALTIRGTTPTINLHDDTADAVDFYIHANADQFYVLANRDGENVVGGGWESSHPLQLNTINSTGYLFGQRLFAENYHPNADKLTTARTITLSGDVTGSASFDGSQHVTINAAAASNIIKEESPTSGSLRFGGASGRGIRFWNNEYYSIQMSIHSDATYGGRLDSTSDYNMYFSMQNGTNRGWVFKNNGVKAQITGAGHIYAMGGLTAETEVSTKGHVESGRGSGGVAMTINDGHGNANLTFNHKNGVPEQNGNSARMEVNTDASTGAYIRFLLKSGVTSGVAHALPEALKITETTGTLHGSNILTVGSMEALHYSSASGTINLDMAGGPHFKVTMVGDVHLDTPSNIGNGGQHGKIHVAQDATGGRWLTFNGSVWRFPDGLVPYMPQGSKEEMILDYYMPSDTEVIVTKVTRHRDVGTTPAALNLIHTDSTSAVAQELTIPTTVRPGDFMVFCHGTQDYSPIGTPLATTDQGWTAIFNDGASGWSAGYGMCAKIATADDAGAVVTGIPNKSIPFCTLYVFRGPIRYTGWNSLNSKQLTNNNPSTRTVASSGMTGDVVAVGMVGSGNIIPNWEGVGSLTAPALTSSMAARPMRSGVNYWADGTPAVDQKVDNNDSGSNNFAGVTAFELIREA